MSDIETDPLEDIDRILCRRRKRDADEDVERLLLLKQWLEAGLVTIAQPEFHEVFRRRYTNRFRALYDAQMIWDYFTTDCVFSRRNFHDRLRMRQELFVQILGEICVFDPEWRQRPDCRGVLGHSPHMKMLACVKLLANGIAADANDDYVRMGKTTQYFYLSRFCRNIVKLFGLRFLRKPTPDDVKRILEENEKRGFPCLESLTACIGHGRIAPLAWAGQYKGYKPWPSIVLEAVASYDGWFWHAFFGMSGSCNDLNVLDASPLFDNILSEAAPKVDFRINGHRYDMGYYLADGIYPRLSTIVQSYKQPHTRQQELFNGHQMGKRKDVERAFGILQAKFHIVAGPVKYWDEDDLKYIMKTCLILHNMIIEDERRDGAWKTPRAGQMRVYRSLEPRPVNYHELINVPMHEALQEDLCAHIWTKHGTYAAVPEG